MIIGPADGLILELELVQRATTLAAGIGAHDQLGELVCCHLLLDFGVLLIVEGAARMRMHHVSLPLLETPRVLAQLPLIVGKFPRSCVIRLGLLRCRPLGEREVPVLLVFRRWSRRVTMWQHHARLVPNAMPLLTCAVAQILQRHGLLIRATRRVASAVVYLVSGRARRTRCIGPRDERLIRK